MLVYVAEKIMEMAALGFLKNPEGMGFPGSRNFSSYPAAQNVELIAGTGLHWGGVAALVTGVLAYILLTRHQAWLPDPTGRSGPGQRGSMASTRRELVVMCMGISGALGRAWRACSR
jgi:ABC-type uncharacterized transport system permease subunit